MLIDLKFSITPQEIDLDLGEIQTVTEPGGGTSVELDETLSKKGYAADAKAVGDALKATVKSVNGVKPDSNGNVKIDTGGGGGSGGTTNHSELTNRDDADSHPMEAITGLEDALAGKQPLVDGMGLSTNDYTDADKEKLDSIEEGAQKNPDALPNPNKLIFTGAVQAEYDGSQEVTIEIPETGSVTIDEIDAEKVVFSEDLTTTTAIGNITLKNGQAVIPATGKNLVEVWNTIFVKEKNPSITQPSVSITFSEAKAYEVGTEVTPRYSAKLNAGSYQYGPATGITASAWSISDTDGNSSTSDSGSFPALVVEDDTSYTIAASATYGDGTIPITNVGNEYAAGQIKAGTKSATSRAITGYRNSFYGTMAEKTTVDSNAIRALAGKSGKSLSEGATFDVVIPIGAMRVVIAYPATIQNITSIKDSNGMDAEISSGFAQTTVDVYGENGYTAIPYKVYTMDFAQANDTENTFVVTI